MDASSNAPDVEALLAQRDFVRRLARRLLADEQQAEDLAQDVLLDGLGAPPGRGDEARGGLRAYLAGVLRHKARRERRAAARRQERERRAARGEPTDPTDAIVAREEWRARIVAAVLELEPRQREAILLRYFEGLPPRRIARLLGVPVETVKTRLKRGLASLRPKLAAGRGRGELLEGLEVLALPAGAATSGVAAFSLGALTMSHASKIALAAVALLCAGVAYRAARPPANESSSPKHEIALGSDLGVRVMTSAESDGLSSPTRVAGPEREVPTMEIARATHTVSGRVLDAQFGVPLSALLEPDLGPTVGSDAAHGGFRLAPESAGATRLRAHASGFEDVIVKLASEGSGQELEIRLHAISKATVIVEYPGGVPAADVPISWRAAVDAPGRDQYTSWIDGTLQRQGSVLETETDSSGRSSMALPTRALVSVWRRGCATPKNVWLLPGEERRVVLPEPIQLRFVDHATRAPVPDFEAEIWFPLEMKSVSARIRSDHGGNASILATSYPIIVRRPGPEVHLGDLTPISDGVSECGFGGDLKPMVRIDRIPEEVPLLIGVRSDAVKMRLVDASTSKPVVRPVRIQGRGASAYHKEVGLPGSGTIYSPGFALDAFYRSQIPDDEGIVVVPSNLPPRLRHEADALVRGMHPTAKLAIVASGYRPLHVHVGSGSPDPATGTWTFEMEPASDRTLQVLFTDGTPFQGALNLYSPEFDVVLFGSLGAKDGLFGPFDWYGGDVLVQTKTQGPWVGTLSENDLASMDRIILTIPGGSGRIEVIGVPPGGSSVPLVARNDVGDRALTYYPDTMTSGSCFFEGLPAGTYLVGPLTWVLGAERQSVSIVGGFIDGEVTYHATRTSVVVGETAVVQWMDVWMAGRTFVGQVMIQGVRRVEPILFPIYGEGNPDPLAGSGERPLGPPRVSLLRTSPRLPVDGQGRYRIEATDPLPHLIAICVASETTWGGVGGLQIVEVIRPGESAVVQTGTLELSWRGALPSHPIIVRLEMDEESLLNPVLSNHTKVRRLWTPHEPLRFDAVPVHVRQLRMHDRVHKFVLKPESLTRIEVDLHAGLPARERPSGSHSSKH